MMFCKYDGGLSIKIARGATQFLNWLRANMKPLKPSKRQTGAGFWVARGLYLLES